MAEEKTALVLLADGSEEMEAVISTSVLRRAGVKTVVGLVKGTAGIADGSRGIKVAGDISLAEALSAGPYDAVVLPGGMDGANVFATDSAVVKLVQEQHAAGRLLALICASPAFVLPAAGVGAGKRVTCYPDPSLQAKFGDKYTIVDSEKVVIDGNLVTSQGPGTAFDFALVIAEQLMGQEKAGEVRKSMLL